VNLLSGDGKVLRFVTLQGTDEPFHPWIALRRSQKFQHLIRRKGTFAGGVAPISGAVAIPSWRGHEPCPREETVQGLSHPDRPLPHLLPEAARLEIEVRMENGDLILNAQSPIVASRPHRHFLARWWVNGEPYVPQSTPPVEDAELWKGMEIDSHKLRIKLDLDPVDLGARSGDRIALQLMYLDCGWEWIEGMESLTCNSQKRRALLSNRLDLAP
jgi:hypothetical protein